MTRTRREFGTLVMVGVGATATPSALSRVRQRPRPLEQARTAAARAAEDVPCCPGTGGRFFARAR